MIVAIRRTLALLAFLISPALAVAQPNTPSDEPIPRELAMALLNLTPGIGGPTDIRVGKAPDNIPPELIHQLGDQVILLAQAAGGVAGTILTICGRVRATTALERRQVTLTM